MGRQGSTRRVIMGPALFTPAELDRLTGAIVPMSGSPTSFGVRERGKNASFSRYTLPSGVGAPAGRSAGLVARNRADLAPAGPDGGRLPTGGAGRPGRPG